MLANYDRIFEEIQDEARRQISSDINVDELVDLVMHVVDEIDQNRYRSRSYKKNIQNLILSFCEHHPELFS